MKTLLDLAPLVVFFGAYVFGDIYAATAALIVACAVQCVVLKLAFGKVERMNLVVFAVTFLLGGLTLVLQNPNFILFKPTIVYACFAIALLVADFGFRKNVIKMMMEKFFTVPNAVWRNASCAWAGFFACAAVFNLWAAFSLSEAAWVKIKTFGFPAATFVFAAAQVAVVSAKDSGGQGDKPAGEGATKDRPLKARIAEKLAALNPLELEVRDDSEKHRGHAEAGNGAHFQVRVVSEKFVGLSRLQRHRLVYETVGKPAEMGLHALAVRALAPDEIGARAPNSISTNHPKGESIS